MLQRLKTLVSPEASPSSSRPASPPPATGAVDEVRPAQLVAPMPSSGIMGQLQGQLPLCAACDACDDDEEDGSDDGPHSELPRGFDMDLEGDMLGDIISERASPSRSSWTLELIDPCPRAEPMTRLAILSTGKTNWTKDIIDDTSSLAFHLSQVSHVKRAAVESCSQSPSDEQTPIIGVYDTSKESKLAVLASSISIDSSDEGFTTARQ